LKEEDPTQPKIPTSADVVVKDLGKRATATKEMMSVYFTIADAAVGFLNGACKSLTTIRGS